MTSKEDRLGQSLQVKVPKFFRCPISLDVMRSPVSLCTGVTYDRASIQRWLDSGHNTCPATMIPLPSTDLVPNLTLQRLIQLWADTAAEARRTKIVGRDTNSALRDLREFMVSDDVEDFEKANLVDAGGLAETLAGILAGADELKIAEAAAGVIAFVLAADFVNKAGKTAVVAGLMSDLDGTLAALLRVLGGKNPESRTAAAELLAGILTAGESEDNAKIAEKDDLIEELVRLVDSPPSPAATIAGLSCLSTFSAASKRSRQRMVIGGVVPAATKVLSSPAPSPAPEMALKVMEGASWCAEGRLAMVAGDPPALTFVVSRMVKVGRDGADSSAATLWSVCVRFPDRKAIDCVSSEGGAAKLLLLMQSGCSPAARRMAAEILRVIRVNNKSGLPRYDTKTTHIMPF